MYIFPINKNLNWGSEEKECSQRHHITAYNLNKKKSHCNTRLPSMSWRQVIRAPISLVYLELLWTWDSLESTKAFQRHLEEVERTILRPLKSSLIFIQENDLKHQKNATTIPQDYEFVSKQDFLASILQSHRDVNDQENPLSETRWEPYGMNL